ncbi:MAG: glycosyltransferase family 2 protein [Candidatus Falkowbacteria bacterium]
MIKKISIVVPVYNEEANVQMLYDSLIKLLRPLLTKYDHELIFVDDGSDDGSAKVIETFSQQDARVKCIEFSRNFGKEAATTAGINNATGDAVLLIDADLQHPVEKVSEFLSKWEAGAEIVIGIREKNQKEGLVKWFGSIVFHKLMQWIGETKIIPRETDFRLLDRKVVDEFNKLTERNRMTRGLIDWLGFRRDYVYFIANPRSAGKAGYGFLKLTRLAFTSFVSYSLLPLKLAGYLGIFITLISGSLGLFVFIERYLLNDPWKLEIRGTAILAIIIMFLVGIILICLGLIALYIANIHGEVSRRPMYILRKKSID